MPKSGSPIRKRSVSLGGRQTSISMEDEFWKALVEIARKMHVARNQLILEIERRGVSANLSSALRVFVLEHYRESALRNETAG